ncbi:MAG TPA: GxxExxY protein [Syntrophomonadaceae bacterium]|nr:GxxExxY protein [Syntrophomonadaceae bacterium]
MSHINKNYLHSELTEQIISCAYKVHKELGVGFLEKVYENSLYIEIQEQGLKVKRQELIKVYYKNKIVGEYYADLLIEDKVIVEVKAISELIRVHETQLINYLKATGIEIGLLINFSNRLSIRRKIQTK